MDFFEGAPIVDHVGRIPSVSVECPEAYARGTTLRLNVEVRVRGVRMEENKDGDIVRQVIFAVEDVSIDKVFTPEELSRMVLGGSAAGHLIALPAAPQEQVQIDGQLSIDPATGEVITYEHVDSVSI